MKLKW
jgi:response regulator RpfG family c-di-GMP phosphodiesterase